MNSLDSDIGGYESISPRNLSRFSEQAESTSDTVLWVRLIDSFARRSRNRLVHSHYDVISAPADGWTFDPFTLTGRNGYFYGRGATDNKGPILAAACAASELLGQRALECDLILLVEGEEETGSAGFSDCVKRNKVCIESRFRFAIH